MSVQRNGEVLLWSSLIGQAFAGLVGLAKSSGNWGHLGMTR
jgi:hypothetical protein